MRGEQSFRTATQAGCAGSSPHARGAVSNEGDVVYDPGSSPHARGAAGIAQSSEAIVGIIPACAGSSPVRQDRRKCNQDHPRMRGEQLLD